MLEYQLLLESANAEIRAFETFNNLNSFLSDVSVDFAMESSFKGGLINIKNVIVDFFKYIANAIHSFFGRLFGKGERLMHKKAVDVIVPTLSKWKGELSSVKNLNSRLRSSSFNTIHGMSLECDDIKEKVSDILSKHTNKTEYMMIPKNDFLVLNTFAEEGKNIALTIVATMEHKITLSNSDQTQQMYHKEITEILNMISYLEKNVMKMIIDCSWDSRLNENETMLKKPILIQIED